MLQYPDAMRMVLLCLTAARTETNWGLSVVSGDSGEGGEESSDALDWGQEPAAHSSSEHVALNQNRLVVTAGGCKL